MTQSELLKSIRQYFWNLNFTEVEIPYLNSSLPLEPNLYTFKTTWTHHHQDFYLPTSPEFALKKFLAENQKNCFAISHCFRDLEDESPDHSPEFLMLEWYETGKTYQDLMFSTQNFINYLYGTVLNRSLLKFEHLKLPQNLPNNEADFNQYFLNQIEPSLPRNRGVFITGYPAFLSPLAAVGTDPCVCSSNKKNCSSNKNLYSSLRFELYINGIEIANGCTENTDADSILKAFNSEKDYRIKNTSPLHPIDVTFATNSAKLNQVAGIGLGINRLLKIINQK